MGNTIKTLSAGDITRKALSILHNNLVFVKTINKEYDDRFARSGAKNGGELLIRNPNEFVVRTGAVLDTQDVVETTQTLTIATQLGVDVNFSSVELTLSMDDFSERILNPAMNRLAAEVDKTVVQACYKDINKVYCSAFGTKPVLAEVAMARALLSKSLAPTNDRIFMTEGLVANSIIAAGTSIFNPASEISRQYDQGNIGQVYGFKFYETEMTPTFTAGGRVDTDLSVDTSAGTTCFVSGTARVVIACSATSQFAKGDVFRIVGCYDVNPETKVQYEHLKQFVITTAVASGAASASLTISPAPVTAGAKQNVYMSTAAASATVFCSNVTAYCGSGAAGGKYVNSLAYHKDAFTFVSADLEQPQGVDFAARKVLDGISMRLVRQYDIINDKFPCRFDVLFGYKTLRPGWACRVSS